jgi:hypothetical protein
LNSIDNIRLTVRQAYRYGFIIACNDSAFSVKIQSRINPLRRINDNAVTGKDSKAYPLGEEVGNAAARKPNEAYQ